MKIKYGLIIIFFYVFTTISAADAKLFPELPGWNKKLVDRVYTSDDLWELINGAADIFLSYYFENLNMAEYDKGDEMIRVELYRHRTTDDTYGIYSAERMPDYPQVHIGAQGYKSQGVLNFFTGNYYVKIMSAGIRESDEGTIALVAEKVCGILNQTATMPASLNLFPEEGQTAFSDSYVAQNFLGYSFMHHAFVMKYEKPSEFQMFIINLPDQVQNMADKYIEQVRKENVTDSEGILILKDQFNGTIFLKIQKGYLIGILNTENQEIAKKFITYVIEKIG